MCISPLATGPNNLWVIQTPTNINLSVGDYTGITCIWEKLLRGVEKAGILIIKWTSLKVYSQNIFIHPTSPMKTRMC